MFDKTLPRYIGEHDPDLKKGSDCVDLCTQYYMKKVCKYNTLKCKLSISSNKGLN